MAPLRPLSTSLAPRGRAARLAVTAAAVTALLAGCGSPFEEDDPASSSDATPAESGDGADLFPVTVENCGEQLTFDQAPQRAFAYYQHPAEVLVALGLQDSVAGYAYPDNDPLPAQEAAYDELPVVSEQGASFEQVIATEPDLVFGGYSSAFDENEGLGREDFEAAGIATYLTPEECADPAASSIDAVYDEITDVGAIFGVPDRAEALIEELRAGIEETAATLEGVDPVSVFVYDSGDDSAFTVGGAGIGQQVIEAAGGRNLFGEVDDNFADVSWEQVVEAQPEVIVILDYYGTPSVEEKIQTLLDRPDLADVPAIVNERFATLTLQDTVMGVRAPLAVETLAAELHPDLFS